MLALEWDRPLGLDLMGQIAETSLVDLRYRAGVAADSIAFPLEEH